MTVLTSTEQGDVHVSTCKVLLVHAYVHVQYPIAMCILYFCYIQDFNFDGAYDPEVDENTVSSKLGNEILYPPLNVYTYIHVHVHVYL